MTQPGTGALGTDSFPHQMAGHCGSGALRDLLEFNGLDYGQGPLSEGVAFGLGGGLGFLYMEVPDLRPPVYLVGRTADMERDFAAHLGIGLEVRATADPREGWDWVRGEIDAGRPPMVWADIAELDYLRVRMTNTRHDIVIVDYDEDQQIALVADNDREELQRCSLESLARARNSNGFPGPNEHTTFIYQWPVDLRDPKAAATAAIRRAVSNMLEGGESLVAMGDATGLSGIEQFASSYPEWPSTFDPDTFSVAMKSLGVFITKAGTGGAMFRSLHAQFLRDMSELLGSSELSETADIYEQLTQTWIELARAAADGDHQAGLSPASNLPGLERAGVDSMRAWLDAQTD